MDSRSVYSTSRSAAILLNDSPSCPSSSELRTSTRLSKSPLDRSAVASVSLRTRLETDEANTWAMAMARPIITTDATSTFELRSLTGSSTSEASWSTSMIQSLPSYFRYGMERVNEKSRSLPLSSAIAYPVGFSMARAKYSSPDTSSKAVNAPSENINRPSLVTIRILVVS